MGLELVLFERCVEREETKCRIQLEQRKWHKNGDIVKLLLVDGAGRVLSREQTMMGKEVLGISLKMLNALKW